MIDERGSSHDNVPVDLIYLTDSKGQTVRAGLWQSLTQERVWHAEVEFYYGNEWRYLDLTPIEEIENGNYLAADGSLILTYTEPVNDEIFYGPEMTLPGAEVERFLSWARERLRLKPQNRARLSGLAQRVA